jgi:hypothetical protein
MDGDREGPPFEPDNIQSPRSLLITDSDVEAVGPSTPYGAVLSWWRALQHGNVEGVRKSYTHPPSAAAAKRQIDRIHTPYSQPVDPEIEKQGKRTRMVTTIRAATPRKVTPSVVAITDLRTSFFLVRRGSGWKLRPDSYRRYHRSWERRRLATQS